MVTQKVIDELNKVYKKLEDIKNLIGLEYIDDEYVCKNKDQVDDEWCDEEMLHSIEYAYQDIGFFLGKR